MSDETVIGDIFLGGDASDVVLGKDIDWTRPLRLIAYVIFAVILIDYFGSTLLEQYRMILMQDEINTMTHIAINSSQTRFQSVVPSSYLYDAGGTLSDSYRQFLERIEDEAISSGDIGLLDVCSYLNGVGVTRGKYTPLSFNMSYLDEDIVSQYFKEDLAELFNSALKVNFDMSNINGGALQSILVGEERFKLVSANVEVIDYKIMDVTNIESAPQVIQDAYKAIYGKVDSSLITIPEVGLTDKKYLVVYNLKYTVKWVPYTGTNFFLRPDHSTLTKPALKDSSLYDRNRFGYVAYPMFTSTYESLYAIRN